QAQPGHQRKSAVAGQVDVADDDVDVLDRAPQLTAVGDATHIHAAAAEIDAQGVQQFDVVVDDQQTYRRGHAVLPSAPSATEAEQFTDGRPSFHCRNLAQMRPK